VPQGSILGPLLFAMLIDDASTCSINSYLVVYADDMTIIHNVHPNSNDEIQAEANNIAIWASNKGLTINVEKSKSMIITLKSCYQPVPISINNNLIKDVQHLRLLGVVFSHDTTWDAHFQHIYVKCCRGLSFLKKLFTSKCPSYLIWQAYKSLVYSHMVYCWPSYCDLPEKFMKKLKQIEVVASRWSNVTLTTPLRDRLNKICVRLIERVAKYKTCHPLAQFFIIHYQSSSAPSLRHHRVLLPPPIKQQRVRKTFIQFCTHT
jgi:hypothetical protein